MQRLRLAAAGPAAARADDVGAALLTVWAASLALVLGRLLGSPALPRLAEAAGNPAGLLTSAVAALLIVLVSLRLRPRRPGTPGAARVAALHG